MSVIHGILAVFILLFNATISFFIFALGAHTPSAASTAMGWWFLALNITAAVLFFQAPVPKPIGRVALFVAVVPLEVLSTVAAGLLWRAFS